MPGPAFYWLLGSLSSCRNYVGLINSRRNLFVLSWITGCSENRTVGLR